MLLLEIALVFALTLYYYTKERRALHMLQQTYITKTTVM